MSKESGKKPTFDLPEDRPASFNEQGHHVALNPAAVRGVFRKYRSWFYWMLIIVFLVLPWTKINGHQTLLFDIPGRRFVFFGLELWAHDAPKIFFLLGILTVGLTFVTALLGRVWCGWACPQTVFIDRIYRKIETWIEGDHVQRMRLRAAPMSWSKGGKLALKWFLFWFVSANIAHSFAAYFVGAERLAIMSVHPPSENWQTFSFVLFLTGVLMFDFGWFREQFCMIMCPYGRFQSVLMDRFSLAVVYDEKRGEPRKGQAATGEAAGDCVNCYRCVAVCPTGVDIRRGVQMECIACTACIDACDEIMTRVNKPKGLIKYSSVAALEGDGNRWFRPRTLLYGVVLSVMFVGLGVSLAARASVEINLVRAIDTPYTQATTAEGVDQVINHFRVKLHNQTRLEQLVSIRLINAENEIELVAPTFPKTLEPGASNTEHVFVKLPPALTRIDGKHELEIEFTYQSNAGKTVISRATASALGPP